MVITYDIVFKMIATKEINKYINKLCQINHYYNYTKPRKIGVDQKVMFIYIYIHDYKNNNYWF